jgi:hypothetical protein
MKSITENPFTAGLAVLVLLLLVGGGVLTLSQLQKQQNNQSKADTVQWYVAQSASAVCNSTGKAVINVTFTNQETSTSKNINVIATDNQTGTSINMGTVVAKATKTGQIVTSRTSLNSGSVSFKMTWSNGTSGSDSRSASYSSVKTCPQPTPTPTPKPTATPTPTFPPGTPTPTTCPTPGTVKNVKIICPYCSPTPSP